MQKNNRPDIQFAAKYYNETKDFGGSRIEVDSTSSIDVINDVFGSPAIRNARYNEYVETLNRVTLENILHVQDEGSQDRYVKEEAKARFEYYMNEINNEIAKTGQPSSSNLKKISQTLNRSFHIACFQKAENIMVEKYGENTYRLVTDPSTLKSYYHAEYIPNKIKQIQQELKPEEARAMIFAPSATNHAIFVVVTKDSAITTVQTDEDRLVLDNLKYDLKGNVYTLDNKKFLNANKAMLQNDDISCAARSVRTAKYMLQPRTDGGNGRMAHQMIETCKNPEQDIKLEECDPKVREGIMKAAQSMKLVREVPGLEEELRKKGHVKLNENTGKEQNMKLEHTRTKYRDVYNNIANNIKDHNEIDMNRNSKFLNWAEEQKYNNRNLITPEKDNPTKSR